MDESFEMEQSFLKIVSTQVPSEDSDSSGEELENQQVKKGHFQPEVLITP